MGNVKKLLSKFKLTIFDKGVSFTAIERIVLIATFVVTIITTVIIPIYKYFTGRPKYSFVLNNPVGWSKNDDIFSIYNYSDVDMKDTTVYIRSYMILSSNSHSDYFDDYMSEESKSLPMEGLDMKFQLTGRSKGKIGHIIMNKENNPFANYFANNDAEFGPNLYYDISNKLDEKSLRKDVDELNITYDKINIVIFTIFDGNTSTISKDLNKIKVYATDYSSDYATGESRTKLVDTNKYYKIFDNRYSYDYGKYYTREDYDKFWNDKDIIKTYYDKFIDEIINESLPDNKKYNY